MVTEKSSSSQATINSKDDYWEKQIFGNGQMFISLDDWEKILGSCIC